MHFILHLPFPIFCDPESFMSSFFFSSSLLFLFYAAALSCLQRTTTSCFHHPLAFLSVSHSFLSFAFFLSGLRQQNVSHLLSVTISASAGWCCCKFSFALHLHASHDCVCSPVVFFHLFLSSILLFAFGSASSPAIHLSLVECLFVWPNCLADESACNSRAVIWSLFFFTWKMKPVMAVSDLKLVGTQS